MMRISNFLIKVSIVSVIVIRTVSSAKILFLYLHTSNSHLGSLTPFIKTMTAEHEVTILQTGTSDIQPRPVSNASVVVWTLENGPDFLKMFLRRQWVSADHSFHFPIIMNINEKILDEFMQTLPDQVRELLNEDWDLLVTDALFTNHGFAFAALLHQTRNVPYIVFTPTFTVRYQAWSLALGGSWSGQPPLLASMPADSADIFRPSSFRDRFMCFFEDICEVAGVLKFAHYNISAKLGVRDFKMQKFLSESAFLLSDEIRGLGHTTPLSNHVQIAGHYCDSTSKLPNDLREFMEDANSKGTIYIAFGTMVRFDFAPEFAIDAIFDAINHFTDYRIIFAFKGKVPREVKSHVKLIEWAPQFDVLTHSNTKLFISHGGLKSLKEAICSKTPMTILPFFAEQGRNAKVASLLGIATVLNKLTIDKNVMIKEISEVLQNGKYAENMRKFHAQYLDMPISQLAEAKFQAEKILRKNGKNIRHKSQGEIISSFSAFYIDLIIAIVLYLIIIMK